jgi:hypothetical protein
MLRMPSDAEWTAGRVEPLPLRWQARLLRQWGQRKDKDYYGANVQLRVATASLLAEPLPLDASDATICEAAKTQAERCTSRAQIFHSAPTLREAMARICDGQGITPPKAKTKDHSAIARMTCPLWWRRKLRKLHGRNVEAAAIRLGFVHRHGDLYVSQEGLYAREQQNARNRAALESTMARNELGQEFTVAELAGKSTANKRNRKAELMTRIGGFEAWAKAHGHVGLFITLTCPSRFHAYRTLNQGALVQPNPKHDPAETPGTAQKYLTQLWACIRANLRREGLPVYGLRIAEPQHDGTPHWHLLLFSAPSHAADIQTIFTKHALKDSPDERGARKHRCDIKPIDANKGSATGYIVKYVSKNIDGEGVGDDLEGKPAIETAKRVEAWATRWSIRQFQQIGGPPVSVWRELRRIKDVPSTAPECIKLAHAAANKVNPSKHHEGAAVAWDQYCEAQGGVMCGRDAPIKLKKEQPEKLGRYGEQQAPRPLGVWTLQAGADGCLQRWESDSTRFEWEIVQGARKTATLDRGFSLSKAQPLTPWTCVNNCTDTDKLPRQQRTAKSIQISSSTDDPTNFVP